MLANTIFISIGGTLLNKGELSSVIGTTCLTSRPNKSNSIFADISNFMLVCNKSLFVCLVDRDVQ